MQHYTVVPKTAQKLEAKAQKAQQKLSQQDTMLRKALLQIECLIKQLALSEKQCANYQSLVKTEASFKARELIPSIASKKESYYTSVINSEKLTNFSNAIATETQKKLIERFKESPRYDHHMIKNRFKTIVLRLTNSDPIV